MAWDAKSSRWDWNNAAFLPEQGSSFRRQGYANELPNEAEVEVSGPQSLPPCSSGVGPCLSPLAFEPSSLLSYVSDEASGPNYLFCTDHRRSYGEMTNSMTNQALPKDWCGKVENENISILLEQRQLGETSAMKERSKEVLESRNQVIPSQCERGNPTMIDCKADRKMADENPSGNEPGSEDATDKLATAEKQRSKAGSGGSGDSLICLKLGKRTYFEDASGGRGSKTASSSAITSAVPTKKARGAASGVQTPRCQVEGCKVDLTSAKEYHRRHKVCEQHSKTARVTVASKEQRFCQQCSRFHTLSEFDEGKRSCRRRLAGHNERRRKPQPDLVALSTRMPAIFEDGRRFEHLLIDTLPFFHYSRIMSNPTLFEDCDDFKFLNGKVSCPRLLKLEDQLAYSCPAQGQGMMDRQLLLSALSEQTNDRPFYLQSSKEMMPMPQRVHPYLQGSVGPILGKGLTLSSPPGKEVQSALDSGDLSASEGLMRVSDSEPALSHLSSQSWQSCIPGMLPLSNGTHGQKAYPYFQGSSAHIGQCLSLSTSPDSGVLSVLEAVPVCQDIPRVSDSGRALSLLASQSCLHVPVPVPSEFSMWSNMTIDQLTHHNRASLAQQMVQGGQQQHFDVATEKFLSVNSHLQNFSSLTRLPTDGGFSLEKEYNSGPFIQGSSDMGKFEGQHMFSVLQEHELKGTQRNASHATLPTINLMQLSSSSQSQGSPMQGCSVAFSPGENNFGDLLVLRSYESCVFDSQQMV